MYACSVALQKQDNLNKMAEVSHEVNHSIGDKAVKNGENFGDPCCHGVGHVGQEEGAHKILQRHGC